MPQTRGGGGAIHGYNYQDSTYDHLKCHPRGREVPKLSLPNTSAPFLPTSALFPLLCEATGLSMHQEEKKKQQKNDRKRNII